MQKKVDYYNRILHVLQELHKAYPSYNMGKHLATIIDECGNLWGVTDKELAYSLGRYKGQLEMDFPYSETEIDRIIKEGLDLDNILKEEDNGDNY